MSGSNLGNSIKESNYDMLTRNLNQQSLRYARRGKEGVGSEASPGKGSSFLPKGSVLF